MEILPLHCRTIVDNAFRHYELVRAGDRLRIAELEGRWALSGLRVADLHSTLDGMVRVRHLRVEQTVSGEAYFLTETGARHLREHPETPEMRRALYQIARRERSGSGLRVDRRRRMAPAFG